MKKFFIHNDTEQLGPFDINDLKLRDIHGETPIWYDGLENWTTASMVVELKEILKTATPPPFNQHKTTPPPIPKIEPQSAPEAAAAFDLSDLSSYWVGEFSKICESKEIYQGEWNTWAFLFSPLWLFVKGAWTMGIIYFVAGFGFSTIENPYISILLCLILGLYAGFQGNWIYYNVKIKKQQFPS